MDETARRRRLILLVFLLAFCIRMIHLLQVESSLFAANLVGDENTHRRWAELLLSGETHRLVPWFRAPLYGFFLALPLGLFDGSLTAVRLVQMLLGSLTAVTTFLIGIEVFSPFVALAAGIFFAVYPLAVYFEAQLLLTSLFTFLAAAGLLFSVRALRRGGAANGAAGGILLGLAFLTRPTILPFACLLAVIMFVKKRAAAAAFAPVFLLLVLVTPALSVFFGAGPQLFPTQGGINFHVGNAGSADGVIPAAPKIALHGRELFDLRRRLGDSVWMGDNMYAASRIIPNMGRDELLDDGETNAWWYGRTLREIGGNPAAFLKRLVRKAVFLVGAWEPPNNTDPSYVMGALYPFLGTLSRLVGFFVLFTLALPGIWIARSRYPDSPVLLLYLIVMSFVICAFFVTARFRIPLVPVLALYLGVSVEWALGRDDPARFRGRTAVAVGVLFAIAVIVSQLYRFYGTSYQVEATRAMMHNTMARGYLQRGDADGALREVELALSRETNERHAYLHTRAVIEGVLLGEPRRALASLEESLALVEHPETLRRLAVLHLKLGEKDRAAGYLERLLKLQPDHEAARQMLDSIRSSADGSGVRK